MLRRSLGLVSASLLVTFCVGVAQASASGPNFGYPRYYPVTARGAKTQLTHGSMDFTGATQPEIALMRVVIQDDTDHTLIQAGWGLTYDNDSLDLCGAQSYNHNFWEYRHTGGTYVCGWVKNADPGGYDESTTQRYTVQRYSASGDWGAWIDGNIVLGETYTGWNSGNQTYTGGEYNNVSGAIGIAIAGNVTGAIFGCGSSGPTCTGGAVPWQYTSDVCCNTGFVTVNSPTDTVNTDGNWSTGSFPQPYQVSH